VRKDGTELDISLSISPVRDSAGKIIGASKIARDITARKRTERELHQSEERFRTLPILKCNFELRSCGGETLKSFSSRISFETFQED
jgi:hypothetical protein